MGESTSLVRSSLSHLFICVVCVYECNRLPSLRCLLFLVPVTLNPKSDSLYLSDPPPPRPVPTLGGGTDDGLLSDTLQESLEWLSSKTRKKGLNTSVRTFSSPEASTATPLTLVDPVDHWTHTYNRRRGRLVRYWTGFEVVCSVLFPWLRFEL